MAKKKGEAIQTILAEIIKGLSSADHEEQDTAKNKLDDLSKKGFSTSDGIALLRGATQKFPPRMWDWLDSSGDLIRAAAEAPNPEYISVIRDCFVEYSPKGKVEALYLLSLLSDRNAALAFMDLLHEHARSGQIPRLALIQIQNSPHHPDIFFPRILDYTDIEEFSWDIRLLLLNYLEAGLVDTDRISDYAKVIEKDYVTLAENLMRLQKNEGNDWIWEDEYQELRREASLCLDLLGYFWDESVKDLLRSALSYNDPRLKYFAAVGLLRQSEVVEQRHLHNIAASPEMRNWFYDRLVKMDKVSLFPEEFKTQRAFAESNMVNWLTYPTELGRAPDEIELMHIGTFDTETEDGLIDYFVFRFRTFEPHWAAKDGWIAGISGPFLRKDSPSTESYGETFSQFEPWESKSAQEHLGDIQETISRWREYRSKNG